MRNRIPLIQINLQFLIMVAVALPLVFMAPACAPAAFANPADAARAGVSDAVGGIAGVVAHTESAQRHVEQALPHADSTGKLHLTAAGDEHNDVLQGAEQAKVALHSATTQISVLEDQVQIAQSQAARLEERWYVIWGRRLERALWILGVSWLVAGVLSIVLGLGNPLSLTWRIGKEITRLVPAMNIFSWVRDWILSRRDASKAQEG